MPGLIGIGEFIDETREDYSSPTTSTFVSRMPQCRQTINALEETLDFDRDGLTKLKKAIKAIHNSGNAHVDNEMYLSRALERLGENALSKYSEPDIGAAFFKFAVVTKELSALMKTLMQNINNIVMFPVDSLLKGDLRGVKGDLKRPFDKASKDYDSKYLKIEKEKKSQAKEAGLIRSEVTSAEIADEMEKERRLFQLQMCEYLIKFNEIKTKKGIELLQHLVEYYHAQTNYFQDGLKTIEHFGVYVADLSVQLQKIRQQQDDERRRLLELRNMLRAATPQDREAAAAVGGYSLHQLQGDKQHGVTRSGYLLKKSEGKVRRVWQKRRCRVTAEGFLDIFHADENKTPARVNLLTCQIKVAAEDKRAFDLVSYNRTYHFQAEDENEQRAWTSVLVNCKEGALMRAFHQQAGESNDNGHSLMDLQRSIIRAVRSLPGNQVCADCSSTNDPTWLSTNFGVIVCIECSGSHRELGVHISRIQSLTLDRLSTSQLLLARHMGNQLFNEVMENTLDERDKLTPESTMEERLRFIREKYVYRTWAARTCRDAAERLSEVEHAVNNGHLQNLLQAYAEGADFGSALPSSDCGETALHLAISRELGDGSCLHIVDFLVQNGGSQVLDKATLSGMTALHLCAAIDRTEPMKLLLKAGADSTLKDANGRTALQIARQLGHHACQELLESVDKREKSIYENINIDWNLSHDDGSTDFSDDDTVIDERFLNFQQNGSVTPEKKCPRSRPPSYAGTCGGSGVGGGGGGGDSPVLRSRSSTCDSLHHAPPTPTTLPRKPNVYNIGSLKKRAAPLPPAAHARSTPSPSADAARSLHGVPVGAVKHRPQQPPPTPPPAALHNGAHRDEPTPPPRKECSSQDSSLELCDISDALDDSRLQSALSCDSSRSRERTRRSDSRSLDVSDTSSVHSRSPSTSITMMGGGMRRCRALYDCSADNEDELSFREGEVIVVINERTEDDNWMEGQVEGTSRRGMFPVSFVHMLPD
ncbi:arfGAP with SH3 domain, ANK repeat and PH domain-containing protein isoform X3 [Vanessa tameamea]|uniref:ArfGAP with SH3 domain, ANK repeat and PH domain-containing protein isoform X3 n=1 Tax=Vanessa tameamea TaxID=334116 RepID=A0A8B8IHM4_VANTA|nr:arfGAP with SH3 domain, ANK repeat and PH domain-containing protein isoform X2 [Vanessa tameamea]XP_047527640.1 arfGAP with SH3 domain, ANK repeat and PH domain-containing protein isoform X3 [Vanessa atalanta]